MKYVVLICCLFPLLLQAQQYNTVNVDSGWAGNSVNVVVFRKNSLVTFKDTQFIAYYNARQHVVLGKRKTGAGHWTLQETPYRGNTWDAHNSISIMVDGDGYLHIAWDHHNNTLHYCKSVAPGSLELTTPLAMTGTLEDRVTYPEFFKLPGGDLLFFYRNGESGKGNLVIKRYSTATKAWKLVHDNVVDGEGERNAYWQSCTDENGAIHLSWVWRESADVASNHDMCYAKSTDGGITWYSSTGKQFSLPITAAKAEYISYIPEKSELINQTSMYAFDGKIFIATYYRAQADSVPQYHIIYNTGSVWQSNSLSFRKTAFSLSGVGTKRIPVSRPQIIAAKQQDKIIACIIFRDEERGSKISVATCDDLHSNRWLVQDITAYPVGYWEPTYDTELWKQQHLLHLFVQYAEQADEEGKTTTKPKMVKVLEYAPW